MNYSDSSRNGASKHGINEVIVKGLPFQSNESDIRDFFRDVGEITNINLLKNYDGRSKGIAFVKFADNVGVKNAEELSGSDFDGRNVFIERTAPKDQRGENRGGYKDNSNESDDDPRGNYAPTSEKDPDSNTVFVGNLNFSTDEESLKEFFEACGSVSDVRIARDGRGNSKGFAYVDFASSISVKKAAAKAGQNLDGRPVRIDYALPNNKKQGSQESGVRGGDEGSNEIYVKGLPFSANEGDIRRFFEGAGRILNVNLIKGYEGRSKGVAFITFADRHGVKNAVDYDGSDFDGRNIFVEKTMPREQRGGGAPYGYGNNSRGNEFAPTSQRDPDSSTIFVGNLSYSTDEDKVAAFFETVGKISDVRIARDGRGNSKGFGYVDFVSPYSAKKAATKAGQTLDGRPVRVDYDHAESQKQGGHDNGSRFHDDGIYEVYVRGLPFSVNEGDIRRFFQDAGKIVNVNLLKTYEGKSKGIAFIKFGDRYALKQAISYDGSDFGGRQVFVEKTAPPGQRGDLQGGSYSNQRAPYSNQGGFNNNYRENDFAPTSERNPDSCTIFVGNLNWSTDEDTIANFFEDCGKVADVRLAKDGRGNSKGFAYVDFTSPYAVKKASAKAGQSLEGRPVRVDFAESK